MAGFRPTVENPHAFVHELVACLTITSDSLSPDEIAKYFDCEPTKSLAPGDMFSNGPHRWPKHNICIWQRKIVSAYGNWEPLDEILTIAKRNKSALRAIADDTDQIFHVVIYTPQFHSGIPFSFEQLRTIVDCGLRIETEIWALTPDEGDDEN